MRTLLRVFGGLCLISTLHGQQTLPDLPPIFGPRTIRRIWEDRDQIAEESRDPGFKATLEALRHILSK